MGLIVADGSLKQLLLPSKIMFIVALFFIALVLFVSFVSVFANIYPGALLSWMIFLLEGTAEAFALLADSLPSGVAVCGGCYLCFYFLDEKKVKSR